MSPHVMYLGSGFLKGKIVVFSDNVRSLYVVQNNVEHLCNSNLLLYYVNPNMYK